MTYYYENNEKKQYEPKGEIYFKNNIQIALWEGEILGQISDGIWENSEVDWLFWIHMKPIISEDIIGWKRYDNYVPINWAIDLYELLNEEILQNNLIETAKFGLIGITDQEEMSIIKYYLYDLDLSENQKEIEKNLILRLGPISKIISDYNTKIYSEEDLFNDITVINESVHKSIRTIGYLKDN
jgi:hypothetical protein